MVRGQDKRNQGFTLVEILLVVLIIGVIAAMVVCATLRNQQGSMGLPWALLADILSCMAFAGAMVATGVIDRADRHDVVQVLRHRHGARA